MKQYKVIQTFYADPENPHEEINERAMDLVNINDPTDRHMCAEDEFSIGEIVKEDEIYFENCSYVYDDGVGNAPFAFKKKN